MPFRKGQAVHYGPFKYATVARDQEPDSDRVEIRTDRGTYIKAEVERVKVSWDKKD